MIQH
ncbi:hypothetical protein ECTW07945_3123, partial [Escherichia coli TW07945]|jgi:hypothetical protein